MGARHPPYLLLVLAATLSACAKPTPQAGAGGIGKDPIGVDPTHPGAIVAGASGSGLDGLSAAQNTDDPAAFAPLQSQAVKDAIYRAMKTGETQRWQDGKLSGYAVPSATPGPNGCRAVRYTVDQRPQVPFESINACSASR
jgi:hypothetical protein